MSKKIYWVLLILINFNLSFSQNTDYYDSQIDSLIEYKIENIQFIQAIDSGLNYVEKVGYFKITPYLIWIYFYDSSLVEIRFSPFSKTRIINIISYFQNKNFGICKYQNHTIIMHSKDNGLIEKYFQSKYQKKNFYYKNSENILVQSGLYNFSIFYKIENGNLFFDEIDESCSINHEFQFDYFIRKGDTWAEIANKMNCNVEDLKKEYFEMETPLEGYRIVITYVFDNKGDLINVTREN